MMLTMYAYDVDAQTVAFKLTGTRNEGHAGGVAEQQTTYWQLLKPYNII